MWEIEPYLDFPPTDGLFSCRLQTYLKREDALPALIFAMDKGVYGRFADMLKQSSVNLRRTFSPEAALACASRRPPKGRHKVIMDCRGNTLKGVLLSADGPAIFQDLPLTEGVPADEELVRNMIHDLAAQAENVEEMIVCGDAVPEELLDGLKAAFENLRLWQPGDFGGLDGQVDGTEFGPQYALAVGAALQELQLTGDESLGVTDRVPLGALLGQKFRENSKLAPTLVVGLLLVCLVGHFTMTKASISRYTTKIEAMKAEKQRLLKPKKKEGRLTKALAEAEGKQRYLKSVLAAGNDHVLLLLEAISETLPHDVVLNRVYQKGDGSYWIEGNAFRGQSISSFHQALTEVEGCTSTKLETIRRLEEASDARQKLLPYDFIINVRF
jgi:hypothetical protein